VKRLRYLHASAMMNAENTEKTEAPAEPEGTPLCLNCMRPVPPQAYYCPHCGEATGGLTTYLPFVNIPWQTRIWGHAWRQVWSGNVSIPGRVFRLLMILWQVPILLIVGLPLMLWRRGKKDGPPPATHPDGEDTSSCAD
jgi:hypothetical protein